MNNVISLSDKELLFILKMAPRYIRDMPILTCYSYTDILKKYI